MRVSVALPQRLGADLVETARRVEALGFDGIFCFDHLVPTGSPEGPAIEAVAGLGAIAGGTEAVRIGSLVLRAGLRAPHVLAGIAATLAMVAPGRTVLGLGAGDRMTAPEAIRFGLDCPPLVDRVARLEGSLAAVRAAPVEVWVGGRHPAVRAVAARADALNVWEAPPTDIPDAGVPVTWGGRVAPHGGRPELLLDGPAAIAAGIGALAHAGVAEVVLTPVGPPDWELLASLARPA